MFRLAAKNLSILTVSQIAASVLVFFYMAFAARRLGPAHFGTYVLIVAYVRTVSVAITAGFGPIAFRELARHRDDPRKLFDDIISMRFALAVVGYLGLVALMVLLGEDRELLLLTATAALTLFFDSFSDAYTAYYTAHERVGIPSAFGLACSVLYSAAGILLLLTGFGLEAIIIAEVITMLIMTAAWTVFFRRRVLRFTLSLRLEGWRRLLMLIIPFAPIHISIQLNRLLNVILLERLTGPIPMEQSVGYYGPPQSITNTAVTLVMSLRRVLIPAVTVRLSQGYTVRREVDLSLKLIIAVFALPLLLGTSFMAPELIALLFGESYAPSAMALVLLGWAGALQIAAIAPETFLFAHPNHKLQNYIGGALASVPANALVCVLLIGKLGIIGAAVGAIAGRLVYLIFVARYCRRQLGKEALRLREFGDVTALLLAAFGVWHVVFHLIANAWAACGVAIVLTLPLMAGYVLYLRPSLEARAGA